MATIEETREVFKNIIHLYILDPYDFSENLEDYKVYNTGLTKQFNCWIQGVDEDADNDEYDEYESIMGCFSACGIFKLLPLIQYLKEKEII